MKTVIVTVSIFLLFACNSKEEQISEKPNQVVKFEEVKSNDSSQIRITHSQSGTSKDSIFVYKGTKLLTSFYYKGIEPNVFYKGGIVAINGNNKPLKKDVFTHESLIFVPFSDINGRVYLYGYDWSLNKEVSIDEKQIVMVSAGKVYIYKDEISIIQSNREGKFAVNKYRIAEHQLLFKNTFQMSDNTSESQLISKIVDSY